MTSASDSDHPSDGSSGPESVGIGEAADATVSLAEKIIERFGGIRPMAGKLSVPVTTVQGWKKRGAIPPTRLDDVRATAERFNIVIEEHEFEALSRAEDRRSPGGESRPSVPSRRPAPMVEPVVDPDADQAQAVSTASPAAVGIGSEGPMEAAAVVSGDTGIETGPDSLETPVPVVDFTPLPVRSMPEATAPLQVSVESLTETASTEAARSSESTIRTDDTAPSQNYTMSEIPPIETAAEIPPVSIPRFEIPPPRVPMSQAGDAEPTEPDTTGGSDLAVSGRPEPSPTIPGEAYLLGRDGDVRGSDGPAVGEAPSDTTEHPGPLSRSGVTTPTDRWALLAVASAMVAMVGAGVTIVSNFWYLPTDDTGSVNRAFEQRLGELQSKVMRDALAVSNSFGALDVRINDVNRWLEETNQRMASIEQQMAARIDGVEAAIPELNQKILSLPVGSPTLAMLLSAAQLRSALTTSSPFQSELAAVKISGFGDPTLRRALNRLSRRAANGVFTQAQLSDMFPAIAASIHASDLSGRPVARFLDQLADVLETFAPPLYRLTGIPSGDSPRAIVARAQRSLAAGYFEAAVNQLENLSGPAAAQAEPWLVQARDRIAADQLRTLLNQKMVALVSDSRER